MSLFETKAKKTVEFYEAMQRDNMLGTMNPKKLEIVESFVKRIRGYRTPDEVMAEYHLKMVPIEKTFGRTRDLTRSAIGLLESWSTCEGNASDVQAETGVWLLGDDEVQDLERVQKLVAGFVKFYKAEHLPPALRKEQLQKQVQEHLHARKTKPVLPPREKLLELQAEYRDVSAHCDLAWDTYHDHLDGYFGSKGEEAARQKAVYAYDRRAGYYHPSKEAAAKKAKAEKEKAAKAKEEKALEDKLKEALALEEKAKAAKPEQAPEAKPTVQQAKPSTVIPTPPGPVAAGLAAKPASAPAPATAANTTTPTSEPSRPEAKPS